MLACQIVSVGCEETHLLSVQWTGYGLRLCDWLSHLANWCAQFLLGALLVFLGCCSRCRPSPLLAPPAGRFLALGSGLWLVGTASARR